MARPSVQPERLFDRPWPAGHPLRPRISRTRRLCMLALLALLLAVIGGYAYLTDSQRVQRLAETYLSRVLNARVEVGGATLSIFEGLRLDNVVVYVDESNSPESILFTADAFRIDYKPQALLTGRLEAEQIIAVTPHVRLTENLDTGRWNYQRLIREQPPATDPAAPAADDDALRGPAFLPELILRDARIEYAEIKAGEFIPRGSMAIEGKLAAGGEPGRYNFELQARGPTEGVGTVARGSVVPATGQFTMRLNDFDFGRDVRSMMPAQVRRWCEDHGLAGRVDVPELSFNPARRGEPASFRVVTVLNNVTLAIDPREYRGRLEIRHQERLLENVRLLRLGPLRVRGPLAEIEDMLIPRPITLDGVAGTFVFDQDGIDIQGLRGRLETNAFRLSGHIGGYTPDAPLRVRITSAAHEDFYIGQSPRYVVSLPGAVREIYDHLRPVGSGRLDFELIRREPGDRPEVNGVVEIVNGQFVFDRFPYPLRNVTGRIILRTDPKTRQSALELKDLRGHGIAGGPNADALVQVNGAMAPLGPETAVKIVVTGKNVRQEPAVVDALPFEARQALAALDPTGERGYPEFRVDFRCDVERLFGRESRWIVNTDLLVHEAHGALRVFPYPLRGMSGLIRVREGRLEIIDGTMQRDDATLDFAGQFTWGRREPGSDRPPRVIPDLAIRARNVPIDDDLINALPEDRREWIRRLGAAGRIDIDGKILPADPAGGEDGDFGFAIDLDLRDGTLLPVDGAPVVTDVVAQAHLTPLKSTIRSFRARRGDAIITGHGAATWAAGRPPQLSLVASAVGLQLEESLYRVLPAVARRAWDQVRPEGTIDAELTYSGDASFTAPAPKTPSALGGEGRGQGSSAQVPEQKHDAVAGKTPHPDLLPQGEREGAADGFQLILRPRQLSVRPQVFPYRMDEVAGAAIVSPGKVRLEEITAVHGEGKLAASGTGTFGEEPVWDLKLSAAGLTVDADLIDALPEALGSLAQKLHLGGRLSAEFPRFLSRGEIQGNALARVVDLDQPATRPAAPESTEFEGTLSFDSASLDVGVRLDEVVGTMAVKGRTADGELAEFAGAVDIPTLKIAGRPGGKLKAELTQLAGEQAMKIDKLRGELAGGEIAGVIGLAYPRTGASKYKMELALRQADVRALVGAGDKDLSGRLTASLALEGTWDAPASRRGRGEVSVAGRDMYNVPILLGLLEITNLAVPINSPFKAASASYIVAGNKVTFESIELRTDQMRMAGAGSLDFDSKRVNMTFTTDNPNWPRLPVIGDLIEGARNELLQIQVRGAIEQPKVSATSMTTFQTTIEEVMQGK